MIPYPEKVKIPKLSSRFMKRVNGYFHAFVLTRISGWYQKYCDYFGIRYLRVLGGPAVILPLPFNTILKIGPKVHEDEALAMDLAHKIGLPAPRLISYGTGFFEDFSSIWMTRLPGEPLALGRVWETLSHEEKKNIAGDLDECILRMRQCRNPDSPRISSLSGSHIISYRATNGTIAPCRDEEELLDQLLTIRADWDSPQEEYDALTYKVMGIAKMSHSSVLTHGDLYRHNILVENGRLSVIVDWECAGWMPEYWDYTTMLVRGAPLDSPGEWETLIYANPGFIYSEELRADDALVACTCTSWGTW
ncbi:kinase-like protein [Agrocybe pediades]|nr:kinase-like protein [Agrocybe pediades]